MAADVIDFPSPTRLRGEHTTTGRTRVRSFEADAHAAAAKLRDAVDALRRARRSLAGAGADETENARAVVDNLTFTGDQLEHLLADIASEMAEATPEAELDARQKAIVTGHPSAF